MTVTTREIALREVHALSCREGASKTADTVTFREVSVLGLVSRNRSSNGRQRRYAQAAVEAAIPLYEGARVFVDHTPSYDNPSVERLLGSLHGVYWDAKDQVLRAKELRAQRTPRTEHALHLMESRPDLVSLSHDVQVAEDESSGEVVSIVSVHCVDLVAGGATTKGLYEQALRGQNGEQVVLNADQRRALESAGNLRFNAGTAEAPRWYTLHLDESGRTIPTQEQTDMTEQTNTKVQELEKRMTALEQTAATEKARADKAEADLTLHNVLEQDGADLPAVSRKALLEQFRGLGLPAERLKAAVAAKREELKALGLLGDEGDDGEGERATEVTERKPAPKGTKASAVSGAGPEPKAKPSTAAVQEQEAVEAAGRSLQEAFGRAAGLNGDELATLTGAKK